MESFGRRNIAKKICNKLRATSGSRPGLHPQLQIVAALAPTRLFRRDGGTRRSSRNCRGHPGFENRGVRDCAVVYFLDPGKEGEDLLRLHWELKLLVWACHNRMRQGTNWRTGERCSVLGLHSADGGRTGFCSLPFVVLSSSVSP
jgi:hypothetical protein